MAMLPGLSNVRYRLPKYRVQHGDSVYLLAHRLHAVAIRNHRYDRRRREALLRTLRSYDASDARYLVRYGTFTKLTGVLYILYKNLKLKAHHTDVVRV